MDLQRDDEWDVANTELAESDEPDIIPYQISYYPADFTLPGYVEKDENGQLEIPPFQRSYVWDQVKASKLIESFLLGLPVPGVFLYKQRKTNRLQVIDGQQRIVSVLRFFKNRFNDKVFRLKNVHPKWDGKTYDELDESDRFALDDTVLRATIVQQLDPQDDTSIYHIFERLNTGGVNLNPMEIRKCVYHGAFFSSIDAMNQDKDWRLILGKPAIDNRLRDVELVLRILALISRSEQYEKPMKGFLNKYMASMQRRFQDKDDPELFELAKVFILTCGNVVQALGEKPFHLRGRLNYAVMDSVMVSLSSAPDMDPREIKTRFDLLLQDEEYLDVSTKNTSDDSTLKRRLQLAKNFLVGE